jgi:hypothetical protein
MISFDNKWKIDKIIYQNQHTKDRPSAPLKKSIVSNRKAVAEI